MAINLQMLDERLSGAAPRTRLRKANTTAPGDLNHPVSSGRLRCLACAHRCVIPPGGLGDCRVRYNHDGMLRVPFGYVSRRFVTSVETHSLFHVLPGARALTFEMSGDDGHEPGCEDTALRASADRGDARLPERLSPEQLVDEAVNLGARVLCAAGDEPMIAAEWVKSVFQGAHRRGLRTALVSRGSCTDEALRYLRDDTDVVRVELGELGGRMHQGLAEVAKARELGYWVEVATWVVPGVNQALRMIGQIGRRIREISGSIPWHLNASVPRDGGEATSSSFLARAAVEAELAGHKFAYVGGAVGGQRMADTRCSACRRILVVRGEHGNVEVDLRQGACPGCSAPAPGLWT